MQGKHIRVEAKAYGDYLQLTEKNGKLHWYGIAADVFQRMSEILNFTYSIDHPRDGQWGRLDPETNKWNGVIADILEDVADVGVAPFILSHSRSQAIDFLLPFDIEEDSFFVRRQTVSSWYTYSLPFVIESWAALMCMLIFLSTMMATVVRFGKDKAAAEFSLEKCAIYVCGAYAGVAIRRWSVTPSTISAR